MSRGTSSNRTTHLGPLVVNTFAPWKPQPGDLELTCQDGFTALQFEAVCPTGLQGTPPHLDLLAGGPGGIVAVESKCAAFWA